MATKSAAAGRYVSRDGEDFIQFVDKSGQVLHSVDKDGTIYAPMIKFPDGSSASTAAGSGTLSPGTNIDAGSF